MGESMRTKVKKGSLGLFLLGGLLLQGCVMSSTHEELQAKYAISQERLQEKTIAFDELEAQHQALVLERDRLAAAKERLEGELTQVLKNNSSLESSIVEMQEALAELERRKAEADARVAEYLEFVKRFQSLIDQGKLKVKIRDGRMVVALATDVLFESGKADLSKDGAEAIVEVAQVLSSIPGRRFQIEGHTDNVPIKTNKFPSNWELAAARAITVVKTMIESGMPPERVSAASFGESVPTSSNETETGKRDNRRIEIVVVPDLSTLPGFNELQNM